MNRDRRMGLIGIVTVGIFFGTTIFQNCAKVNYQTTTTPVTTTATGISRSVTIDPTFNQQKADVKVLFVVDDSYTMSQSQAQLAAAVDSLLTPLQGHNAEFKIVSTSGVPSNEVDYTISTRYLTEQRVEIPFSQVTSVSSYLVEKNIVNTVAYRHQAFKLYRDSTTSQFNSLKTQIKAAIQSVGVNGSDTEEGFCATARQLFDQTSSKFFKPGDKAAVVILSDENDSSEFSKCVTRYVQRVSSKPVVYYNYGQLRARLTLEYQISRDGVTSWVPVVWGVGLSGAQSITLGANCSANDKSTSVQKLTSQGYNVRNVSACVYESVQASYYGSDIGDDGTDSTKNLCSSSTYFHGQFFSNLYTMVNSIGFSAESGSCTKQIVAGSAVSQSIEYDSVVKSDMSASNTQDLKYAIFNKSTELFGNGGFIVASLVHLSGESCALATGQSYGTKYHDLKLILNNSGVEASLCSGSFSSVLSQVSNFVVTESTKSYVVSGLTDAESVTAVSVRRGGSLIKLTSSDYELVRGTITLTGFVLVSGDVIEVTIGDRVN